MMPAAGSHASATATPMTAPLTAATSCPSAGHEGGGEAGHRGREDDVEAKPGRVGDAAADCHADQRAAEVPRGKVLTIAPIQ